MTGLEILVIGVIKAAFGKAAVGGAVKVGLGVATKAALVHDAIQTVDALSNAAALSLPDGIDGGVGDGPSTTDSGGSRPRVGGGGLGW